VASNKPAKKAATKKAVAAKKAVPSQAAAGRNYFKQSEFPLVSLQQAQKIAAAIVDNFASEGGSPPDVALAIGISPTSSAWPSLAGASIAYGLTAGGVNANAMTITDLGKKLVAPELRRGGHNRSARSDHEATSDEGILREIPEGQIPERDHRRQRPQGAGHSR
jgi:hypothetical protein